MASQGQESSTTLAIIPTEEHGFKGLTPLGDQEFKPDNDLRTTTVALDELGRANASIIPNGDAGTKDLTHADSPMETFRPTRPAAILQSPDPRVSMMARIADIDGVNNVNEKRVTGALQLAVVDEAYTNAEAVMRADVVGQHAIGKVSRYESLIGKSRDVSLVWYLDRSRARFDGKLGALVLVSILTPDRPEDVMAELTKPKPGGETADDQYAYGTNFINKMVADRGTPEIKSQYKALADPNSRLSRLYIRGLAMSYLEADWDFENKHATVPIGKKGRQVKLTDGARECIRSTRSLVADHHDAISEPLRIYLRMALLNTEYDELRAQYPASKKEIEAERLQAWNNMRAYETYLAQIEGTFQISQGIAAKAGDTKLPIAAGPRLQFTALDDIDARIVKDALIAKEKKSAHDYDIYDREILESLIAHLGGKERGRNNTLLIRALGRNAIHILGTLSPSSIAGEPKDRQIYMYDGEGMPQYTEGHYPDELVAAQVQPDINSDSFKARGNAVEGNMVIFDLKTPEREADPATSRFQNHRFLVTSGKLGSFCIAEETVGAYYDPAKPAGTDSRLVDGSIELTELMTKPRIQTWRVASRSTTASRMVLSPKRYQNGSAFALAYDNTGNIYPDSGVIKGQRPMVRQLGMKRDKSKENKFPEPTYIHPQTGKLPIFQDEARTKPVLDSKGRQATRNNILVKFLFVNGGVRVVDTPSKAVSVRVTPHFRVLAPQKAPKKGLLSGRKA